MEDLLYDYNVQLSKVIERKEAMKREPWYSDNIGEYEILCNEALVLNNKIAELKIKLWINDL